jgi:hypothetical protein
MKIAVLLLLCVVASMGQAADDWPLWRNDAERSAATKNSVPDKIVPLWQSASDRRVPAWDDPLGLFRVHEIPSVRFDRIPI